MFWAFKVKLINVIRLDVLQNKILILNTCMKKIRLAHAVKSIHSVQNCSPWGKASKIGDILYLLNVPGETRLPIDIRHCYIDLNLIDIVHGSVIKFSSYSVFFTVLYYFPCFPYPNSINPNSKPINWGWQIKNKFIAQNQRFTFDQKL